MEDYGDLTVEKVLTFVEDAVVFTDDQCCECLHWLGGFKKLLESGALGVRDIKHTKECLESEAKVVFLVSSPLLGQVAKYIQRIVKSSDFSQIIVISTLSAEVNEFICQGNNQIPVFEYLSRELKKWTQNEMSTVGVYYVPISIVNITPDFFVTPTHNNVFPVLPSDVARLQAFLHSRGDKRMFNNLGNVDIGFLPHNVQSHIKMITSSLSAMFEKLDINEDCYSVGHYSRLIANELANMPDSKGRRKTAASRASIIFVDRTLDLVGPTSHNSDNVLGTIYEILPRLKNHNNDVAVDMSKVFSKGNSVNNTIFPGCLSHYGDDEVQDMLQCFIRKTKKQSISFACEKLIAFMKKESIPVDDIQKTGSLKNLQAIVEILRNNSKIIKSHRGILQCSLALVNALTDDENEHLEELLSAEKGLMLELGDEENNPFAQTLNMLTKEERKRFSVVDALMFCLLIYSGGCDISNTSPAHEEKVKEAIINVLMDGNHEDDLLFLIGDLDASERQIRTRIADVFERLRVIGSSRNEMKNFRSVLVKNSMGVVKYRPIVEQIIQQIFDGNKTELEDVEFRSHGLRDFLKTGFGFFMNVTKPRPDDHPLLILFVVGGITWYEINSIQEALVKYKPSQKVLVGSTRVITPSDILEQVLCSENLFVDVDT